MDSKSELIKTVAADAITKKNFFEHIGVTPAQFCEVVDANPSIWGVIIGYVAERKLREFFINDKRVSGLTKDDDHDRTKKGDLNVIYKKRSFKYECKPLQSNSIKRPPKSNPYEASASYQCDASDCRPIKLRNGHTVTTTCLEVGEFDIVAVNLFALQDKWQFAFALNYDLPRTKHNKYKKADRLLLLATLPKITWPVERPYVLDPFVLMYLLIAGQKSLPRPV
jgi:hypothetical protein